MYVRGNWVLATSVMAPPAAYGHKVVIFVFEGVRI